MPHEQIEDTYGGAGLVERGAADPQVKPAVLDVLALKEANAHRWRDRDDNYWFARLAQEVGELGSSLVGDHDDPPEHELRQIASIALNWLEKRSVEARPTTITDCGCGMGAECIRAAEAVRP